MNAIVNSVCMINKNIDYNQASNQNLKMQYEQHLDELCLYLNQSHNKGNLHRCYKKKK